MTMEKSIHVVQVYKDNVKRRARGIKFVKELLFMNRHYHACALAIGASRVQWISPLFDPFQGNDFKAVLPTECLYLDERICEKKAKI